MACNSFLAVTITSGARPGGILESFFKQFWDGTTAEKFRLMSKVRIMAYDMGAQVRWRFTYLLELPYSIFQSVNPGLPKAKQDGIILSMFKRPPCCLGRCAQKVVKVYKSAENVTAWIVTP